VIEAEDTILEKVVGGAGVGALIVRGEVGGVTTPTILVSVYELTGVRLRGLVSRLPSVIVRRREERLMVKGFLLCFFF